MLIMLSSGFTFIQFSFFQDYPVSIPACESAACSLRDWITLPALYEDLQCCFAVNSTSVCLRVGIAFDICVCVYSVFRLIDG